MNNQGFFWRWRSRSLSTFCVVVVALCACRSPQGPLAPQQVRSPRTPLTIVPVLANAIGVPEGDSEQTSWTADGRMRYFFKLQNRTPKEIRLRLTTSFYDETGALVDEQGSTTFLEGYRIKPLTIVSNSKSAKRVQVQVSVAD